MLTQPRTNAFTAAYDWRLSCANLEKRDHYFTRLRSHIETAVLTSNEKVVLVSHSMGSQVLFYFFHWVEASGHGGPGWVDKYVGSWINVSGSMLGALKGLPAVLSGEMKDTAQLNAFAVYGLEKFLGKDERCEIFRSMPGASSMLPKGGNAVWGNKTWAPDDQPGQMVSFGTFINFKESNSTQSPSNLTVEESISYLLYVFLGSVIPLLNQVFRLKHVRGTFTPQKCFEARYLTKGNADSEISIQRTQ